MITKFEEFSLNESLATDIVDKIKTIFHNGLISKEKYESYLSRAKRGLLTAATIAIIGGIFASCTTTKGGFPGQKRKGGLGHNCKYYVGKGGKV